MRWRPAEVAVVICDMWDAHHCVSAVERVAEMAPHLNQVVCGLRDQGALIIHAPSSCMDFYRESSQRARAIRAPEAQTDIEFDWRDWDQAHEGPLPASFVDTGPCSCASSEPCCTAGPPYPWSRQIPAIDIAGDDAVSDDGRETFNLLEERGIETVVVMGVATNICVLGRPFGIRQLVYEGKRPVLCRDLTDSFHRDDMGHVSGTDFVVEHIERYWCPSVTSDQLVGGEPFRFQDHADR